MQQNINDSSPSGMMVCEDSPLKDWNCVMKDIHTSGKLIDRSRESVRIHSFCKPQEIRQYTFDPQFTVYAHYKSIITDRDSLEKVADQPHTNIVLALTESNRIIGYGVLAYPDPGERWNDLGPPLMLEVKAIEVGRSWRSSGIAAAILKMLVAYPQVEEKIVYMVGYSWTWDLSGAGKTVEEYRQMLIKLFGSQGFQEYSTNEPNICLKPENLFMCWVGNKINPVILDRFKWLRFGLSPWTWGKD